MLFPDPFRPYQCTFADPCHGGDLAIGLALFQEGQCQSNLFCRELLRSALSEVRVLSGDFSPCLRAFNNHNAYRKARQNQHCHCCSDNGFSTFSSLPPRYRLKEEAPPTPNVIASVVIIITRGNDTFVAAFPSSPILFPIKI